MTPGVAGSASLLGAPLSDQTRDVSSSVDLVGRAAAGEHAAWRALIGRYELMVDAVVRCHGLSGPDAEDARQTVWCRLAEHLDGIRSPERVGSWIARTAHREAALQVRLARRARALETGAGPRALEPVDHRTPESEYLRAEEDRGVREAIASVGEPERTVLALDLHRPGASAAEVADCTGLPVEEVPTVRRRARRRLFRLLRRAQGPYEAGV